MVNSSTMINEPTMDSLLSHMHFQHKPASLPELKTTTINNRRYYIPLDGNKYPSITTVLSGRDKKGILAWRKRVGEDVANAISRKATNRGTKFHTIVEDFLNNEDVKKHRKDFLVYEMFLHMKNSLMININNIRAQECGLYSNKYRVAGRVDCIAEYDGVLSIIDFKTSRGKRKDNYNENYYIQASAYAEMFEEMTGEKVEQIAILVVTEDGEVQPFLKKKYDYLPLLIEAIEKFNVEETKERPS